MKLSIASLCMAVSANVFSNLGFMRTVSNRLPGQMSNNLFVQTMRGVPDRKTVQRNLQIQKSGLIKSRRQRNTITNDFHFDQPVLYRNNPTYAMRPEVMNGIRFPREMKPST